MKTGIKRKKQLAEFTIKEYAINAGLMAILFLFGLYLSWKLSTFAGMLYLLLWLASYPIIHATTCRHCVYHGKRCPVPLEGSCSHLIFDRGDNFGILAKNLSFYFKVMPNKVFFIFHSVPLLLAALFDS